MTDIKSTIPELRYLAHWSQHHLDKAKIANDAADAIEALQGEVERLTVERDHAMQDSQHHSDKRLALQAKLDALEKQEPVASIYISAMGREFDDWKCELPEGRNLLYAAPKALEPLTDEQVEALVDIAYKHWQNQRIFDIAAVRADFRAHGIGGTP